MIICEILLIAAIVVFVVDLSGFTESWRRPLSEWLRSKTGYTIKHFPPFDCSLCLTFWAGLMWFGVRSPCRTWRLSASQLTSQSRSGQPSPPCVTCFWRR